MFKPLSLSVAGLISLSIASNDVTKCVDIKDDNQRLECYDSLFRTSAKQTKRSLDKQVETEVAENPDTQKHLSQSQTSENKIDKTADTNSQNQTIILKQADIFGFENEVENLSMEQLESRAVGQFSEWKKGTKFKLENGQVWQVTNSRTLYHTTENPSVIIEKGAFGSFFLRFKDLNRRLKVKRLK